MNLLTYVYWRGDIARDVAELLCRRAREGIDVNVLLDWVGTVKMDSGLIDRMRDAGVCVAKFRPLKPYAIRRLNNRTHRRLLVADGRVGMTGGLGIAEEWTGDALVGPGYLPELEPVTMTKSSVGGPMQVVRSKSGVGDTNVEALYFLAIESARATLDLTAAYFAPRPAFVQVPRRRRPPRRVRPRARARPAHRQGVRAHRRPRRVRRAPRPRRGDGPQAARRPRPV